MFLILIIVSVILMYYSGSVLGNKLGINAILEFAPNHFTIKHYDESKEDQIIEWKTIYKLHENNSSFIIDLDKVSPHFLFIKKAELNAPEIEYFKHIQATLNA